ncbi:MAG: FAD-dependent oxidoreductase [Defluviitaleaceae bacterium]|nr:FAD-dependent oxidoreductase [Defluviitaleaceae bacterium]
MKYVIIGNSTAGIGAVEGIRQIDQNGEITIISNEPFHTYSRPLISYSLRGKVSEENMCYRAADFYEKNNCKLLAGVSVTEVNADKKCISTDDGNSLPYDKLLVATGSSPFTPPFEGLDTVKNKFTFTTKADVERVGTLLTKKTNVLIIGAGLIGLKCAEGMLDKVSNITVVDLSPRILSSILDDHGAGLMQKHLEGKGINFKLSCGVKSFNNNTATFESGETYEFDILILAVGVRPNTDLLRDIAEIDKGIKVNAKSQTSAADIYAAGDCTLSTDISDGQSKIMALLPNAYMQGECAGINMAGGEKSFDKAIPMNAIGFCGLNIITAGNYTGETFEAKENNIYKRLFYGDNKLNGYIMIDEIQKAGIYTSLIRERTPLDTIDFALICEKPGLMAFSKKDRATKLGGEAS